MVRIRLRRVGAKKQPSYRVVVIDARSPRDGQPIEVIGSFNPRTEPETVGIDEARALYWLSQGAQPSAAVERLLKQQGTLARMERLRKGESIEALLAEAQAALVAAPEGGRKTRPAQQVQAQSVEAVQEPAEGAAATEDAPEGEEV
ncbi:MAG: 30S ribosomal protein S16 [Anaerolineales bacterium]|nr:30S ribosomal protein S16 [Anaerolineales bacterium]